MFRVGNLRCNYLFEPQLHMNVMKHCVTMEGESVGLVHRLHTPAPISTASTRPHTHANPSPSPPNVNST